MFYVIKQKQNKRLAREARQALILLLFYLLYFAWREFTLSVHKHAYHHPLSKNGLRHTKTWLAHDIITVAHITVA